MIMMSITRLATRISLNDHDDFHQIDDMGLSMVMMIIIGLTTWISLHDHDDYHLIGNMDLSS